MTECGSNDRAMGQARATADILKATGRYLKEHDTQAIMADVECLVKSHPSQALLAAVVLGYLAGCAFIRK